MFKLLSYPGTTFTRIQLLDEIWGVESETDEVTKLHIFDKFFQGDEAHSRAGNGLGLTMVKRIVELCGGTVKVESSLENGSIFTVLLPK
ncbi:MAG: ATP-binding protein [Oscillospiraceae bacterium]|nr:ATP-binding protein [Oscillospiraceae bacterium]